MSQKSLVPTERIEREIRLLRGQKVMLDADLAELYGVQTKRLNEQVRRNRQRFPEDFMFKLTQQEFGNLRSQIATSRWGGRRSPPYAFTEHGALMAASVLNTPTAIRVSVQVVRAFIRLRQIMASNEELSRRLDALEKKYDARFKAVFQVIRQLMEREPKPRRRIGFSSRDGSPASSRTRHGEL